MDILSKNKLASFRKLKQKKNRDKIGLYLIEGLRIAEEAIKANIALECVIVKADFVMPSWLRTIEKKTPFFSANQTQLEQLSDTRTPQAIILVGIIPESKVWGVTDSNLVLGLDRISDPGNYGTILRTAIWFGVNNIIPSANCVDNYSPKVVRASMGAIFHAQIYKPVDLVQFTKKWQGKVLSLDMNGEPLEFIKKEKNMLIVVGSEAHGVSKEILQNSTIVSIGKKGIGESLNAGIAVGIALWELKQ